MRAHAITTLILLAAWSVGCGGAPDGAAPAAAAAPPAGEAGIDPKKVADMLHAVMEADRTVYTQQVVNRLVKTEKVTIVDPTSKEQVPLRASEQWKSEHGKLPLPAQMFRMGSEKVTEKNVGFTYGLLSLWPVNKQNKPKTDIETKGLEAVNQNGGKAPFYGTEELGGKKYFTAVYADVAVADACIDCHNDHTDSPRTDFKLGDVMGGVVLRIPMEI
jgi:hypothetical protein